ncbi:beta-lactamase/transpeptidase-like protein [Aspergillus insuetus]
MADSLSAEFRDTLSKSTAPGSNKVPGCILAAVDRNGESLCLETSGSLLTQSTHTSSPPMPINPNSTFWMASCGKLIATLAALQCVERGLISLDDPNAIARILPELTQPLVFTDAKGSDLTTVPATTQITLRHLLSHTSGLAYDFFEEKLQAWRVNRGEPPVLSLGGDVVRAHSVPLLFEPGTGFVYGGGIDWTGELIARLTNTSLESYLQTHIFQPLNMTSTTFRLQDHGDIQERIYPMYARGEDGTLSPSQNPWPAEPSADCAGAGLYSSVPDFIKLLADLIREEPRLLKKETIETYMFSPQFPSGSEPQLAMAQSIGMISAMTGSDQDKDKSASGINLGLGGVFFTEDSGHIKAGTLAWGGLPNVMWSANRKVGVATLFATQLLPYNDAECLALEKGFRGEVDRISEARKQQRITGKSGM